MQKKHLGRIGVLMGGLSSERDISLKSGNAVCQALTGQGLEVIPLDIRDTNSRIEKKLKSSNIALAFIALHGKFGEDGTVQKILESLDIPYTGSGVLASYLCLDKIASRIIFQHCCIPVPDYLILNRTRYTDNLKALAIPFPVVVKPSKQGSSIGVTFVRRKAELKQALEAAFRFDENIILERFISGREITVGILGSEALPIVEILPKKRFFDFQAKYEKGKSDYIVPARLPRSLYQRVQQLGLLAHQSLGCCGFSRVDLLLDKGRPKVLEVNSIPGLTSKSLLPMAAGVCGMSFAQLCLKIIALASRKS